jgi:hypothetical protein
MSHQVDLIWMIASGKNKSHFDPEPFFPIFSGNSSSDEWQEKTC